MGQRLCPRHSPPSLCCVATLSRIDADAVREVLSDTLIGRSSACSLRLDATDVSKEHAALSWTGEQWTLRDLNSRNGTFVNGERLGPEDKITLTVGMQLSFGANERWVCTDLAAPAMRARTVDEGPALERSGQQLLAFGSEGEGEGDELSATLSRDVQGRWVLERESQVAFVSDGEELEIGGRRWRLTLPEHSPTTELSRGVLSVYGTTLRFDAPPDHPVHIRAVVDERVLDLKRRGHHHLTLALARVRLADTARGLSELEAGWVSHVEAQRLLECTRNLVNVNVHRARKQLEELGFVDAGCLIERRQTTGKMRIGVPRLEVAPLAEGDAI